MENISCIDSTMLGSKSVEVSPIESVLPVAIFLRIRRMIFPERVFGNHGTKYKSFGSANPPISVRIF